MLAPRGFTPKSAVSRLLWTVGVVLAAMLVSLILQRGLGVERVSVFYFGAVLACAGWLGVWYGLVAALVATVAFSVASVGPGLQIELGTKQDYVNLVVYATGAWVAGLYVDETRRERDALVRLTAGGRGEPVGLLARVAASPIFRWAPLIEMLRIAGALIFGMASVGIGLLVFRLVGPLPISMIYLTGVVLAASLLGARAGLVTALTNVMAYDYFVLEPRFTFHLSSVAAGVNLVVFLAVGWQVGMFAERVRYERRAVRTLFDAGRSFSATADEVELRQLIADAIAMVARGRYVLVRDEEGRTVAERGQRPPSPPPPATPQDARKDRAQRGWRVMALRTENDSLGSVAWLATAEDKDLPIEATVSVLVDLGAAAIARARLSTEHAHLEVVAQTEQLRRALLASVSHDLRTPLSGIMGSSTSLLDHFDKYDEEVRRDLLSNIREQSYRLNRYVENLLGMTRLESGALQPKLEQLSLEAIVYESWEMIADSAGATRPLFRVEEEQLVFADAALLRQVVSNLLENAVKFSPAGSTVEVGSEQHGGHVVLTISDQGVGASDAELEHFFEPFVRGKQSKGSGVGLGLFIARSFLEAMGGTIAAKSRRDGRPGLSFEVTLPAIRQLEPVS